MNIEYLNLVYDIWYLFLYNNLKEGGYLITKYMYYTALSKWNGKCAVGEFLLNQFDFIDNEIKKCKNNKIAIELFLQKFVINGNIKKT